MSRRRRCDAFKLTPQYGGATLAPMTPPANPTEPAPQPAGQSEQMICWTQLLREPEPVMIGPPRPLGPMLSWAEMEQLFATLDADPLD